MGEWVRFFFTAFFLILGLLAFVTEVIGVVKFGFVMNRMHAVGLGDAFGLMCVTLALIICSGFNMDSLKLFLLILFMWLTSPVSTHLLARIEMNTNPDITKHVRIQGAKTSDDSGR